MEIVAKAQSVRMSPRKVRLVADTVRDMAIADAMATLQALHKRPAMTLAKTLKSAVANAVNNAHLEAGDLVISRIEVTEGPFLKRFHPSTRGRIHPYKRRSSHILIGVKEKQAAKPVAADKGGTK